MTKEIKTPSLAPCPIALTEGAKKEIKMLMYDKELPENHVLRIGVKGGGCSGLSYILGFDEQKETDDAYEVDGIPVIIERAHTMYLVGMEVDYLNGLQNRGFIFNNPNATDTCGCGTSFTTE